MSGVKRPHETESPSIRSAFDILMRRTPSSATKKLRHDTSIADSSSKIESHLGDKSMLTTPLPDRKPKSLELPKIQDDPIKSTPKSSRTYSPRPIQTHTPKEARHTAQPAEEEKTNHLHSTYKFLYPPNRRDINKRCPDDSDYDERTLYVPESFLNSQTPALRQWWIIKQKNMDCILFFKMGKFYELFNEDAVIGVNNLDIAYMKGDESKPAHAGFPEVSYEKYSRMLIDRGYKVIRIEQTETPAMMEERCIETGRRGKFDKVVKREVCRVTSKGTQMLGVMEQVFHSAQNQYLMAIRESHCDESDQKTRKFGVSFIDVTIGKLHMGQFQDDHNLSKLNILLVHHKPTEILIEKGCITKDVHQALLRTGAIITGLKPSKEFWAPKTMLEFLNSQKIFKNHNNKFEWPKFLVDLFEDDGGVFKDLNPQRVAKEEYIQAIYSFGAILYYLNSHMIADQVMSCATFEEYRSPLSRNQQSNGLKNGGSADYNQTPMILDHIALQNLEIFENSQGTCKSTLFEGINNCKTHFGERLLKNWLCSPLCDIEQINNRLDAVGALSSNENASLANELTHVLSSTPDLDRLLSKIRGQCFKSNSDSRAIMFDSDQYSKAKITSFLTLLRNFQRLHEMVKSIETEVKSTNCSILIKLLSFTKDGGLFPDYADVLSYFDKAFNHDIAKKTGKIIPAPGVVDEYDDCKRSIDDIKIKLDEYLDEQRRMLKCSHLEYFGSAKNRYQIQVPEKYCEKVPSDYRIETTRKGYKRYYTPKIDKMLQKLMILEEELQRVTDNIMSNIFAQFVAKIKYWSAAIDCFAILDVLQSIASFVRSLKANGIHVCRPEFVELDGKATLTYTKGRHPALISQDPNFTPNDLTLDDRLILLTGANMGGKSTLMRQTALLVVLAQIGCFVPASSMQLTPVDRIFSRLGASDKLIERESTFYTELVETSAMLNCATYRSLLLLDELGRGTSTYDGTAIAYAVIKEITDNMRCRCLFSTHYHSLVRDFEQVPKVRLAHMACKVEHLGDNFDKDPLQENITFLYKMVEGPVARSYGFNVAKLAGIKDEIIREAFNKSKELELAAKVIDCLQSFARTGGQIRSVDSQLKQRVLAQLS